MVDLAAGAQHNGGGNPRQYLCVDGVDGGKKKSTSPVPVNPLHKTRDWTAHRAVFAKVTGVAGMRIGIDGGRRTGRWAGGHPRGTRGSAAVGRGRLRQGDPGRERHLSVVSGVRHQADDDLCDAEGVARPPDQSRNSVYGIAQRGGAAAVEDGLQGRHPGHGRQCPQDAAGAFGERHGGGSGRGRFRFH